MSIVAPSLPGYRARDCDAKFIAEACSSHSDIAKVMGVIGLARMCTKAAFNAVYVVSPDEIPVCKVGVSNDPIARLQGLQCGNWNRLYVRSLFWCATNAYEVESAVLAKLKSFRVKLEGEWAGIDAEDMALLIAKCASDVDAAVAPCSVYLEHWVGWSADRMERIKREARNPTPRRARLQALV